MTDFAEFYRQHAPGVLRFCIYLSGNRSDAEDITAETFVRVWASNEVIRTQTVKAYLFTIARNLFLQGARRQSRNVELSAEMRDLSVGPQELAEHKAELERVLARLQKLAEIDRAALLMRALEGMPYEEIATALGISLTAARVRVHRARLTLSEVRNE